MLENEIMTYKRDSRTNFDHTHGKNMNLCFSAYSLTAGKDYYILLPEINLVSKLSNYITYIFTKLAN